jgi:hypothetical protein
MPRNVDRLALPKLTGMCDDRLILAQLNPAGVGPDLGRPAGGSRGGRVFVVVETHQTGLENGDRHCTKSVEALSVTYETTLFFLELLPDGLL